MEYEGNIRTFIRLGKYIINLDQIAGIEVYQGGGMKVYLTSGTEFRLDPPDSDALLLVIHPREA